MIQALGANLGKTTKLLLNELRHFKQMFEILRSAFKMAHIHFLHENHKNKLYDLGFQVTANGLSSEINRLHLNFTLIMYDIISILGPEIDFNILCTVSI